MRNRAHTEALLILYGDPSGREEVQRAGLHSLPQRTNHPPFCVQPSNTIWPTSQASALLWGKIFLLLLLMSTLLDNGVGTQQPTINGSVEGGRVAAFKTSVTRRIAPPPLLLPLPGMHIQSLGKGGGRGGFEVEDGCRRLTSSCACNNVT
jgi:hypothetical protein